jgi:hypothetical protein
MSQRGNQEMLRNAIFKCVIALVIAVCMVLILQCFYPPSAIAVAWRDGKCIVTNTTDEPLHHIDVDVTRNIDDKSFNQFLATLDAHTSKTYLWNSEYSPIAGGKIVVSWHGSKRNVTFRIKR